MVKTSDFNFLWEFQEEISVKKIFKININIKFPKNPFKKISKIYRKFLKSVFLES